jgi:hypothetical protein
MTTSTYLGIATAILFLFFFLAGIVIGWLLGKQKERKDWNKLIAQGKIPKPKNYVNFEESYYNDYY